jgi:hypothetical protein
LYAGLHLLARCVRVDEDRIVQVPAVGGDDPHARSLDHGGQVLEEHVVGPGVGAVDEVEAVALLVHLHERPDLAVDDDRVADELGHPVRVLRVDAHVGEEELTVGIEHAVLDDQRHGEAHRAIGSGILKANRV